MIPNHSPWIRQLARTRPAIPLSSNRTADVAIVGGGIAGVTTAYFTLRDTNKTVTLLEADMVAHGATGHNAGQIASYFERPLYELVHEFGLDLAIDGQKSIESAWGLLDQIVAETGLDTPLHRFVGHAGLTNSEQVLSHLKDNHCRAQGGLTTEQICIAKEWEGVEELPAEYASLYKLVPHTEILGVLETHNPDYIALLSSQKGCMNSALFSEQLIDYLTKNYADRFTFFEKSPVKTVRLNTTGGTLDVLSYTVTAERIVLCTNGFEHFKIINESGMEIDTQFHHSVGGRIGYMSGYIEPYVHQPTAISYFPKTNERTGDPTGESYFYFTRRPQEHEGKQTHSLVCTGGPEIVLPNGADYSREESCAEEMNAVIDDFLRDNYGKYQNEEITHSFCWHGLMGYTPNGIRRVGAEPINPVLLYNLGCNGVGILPSIFGGQRIAHLLRGDRLAPSLFDPHNQS